MMIPFLLGIAFTLWIQVGLYGVYLSACNTNTHKERVLFIFENRQDYFRPACLLVTFIVALSGPVIYLIAKLDQKRWQMTSSTRL